MPEKKVDTSWVAFLDVYGFSNMFGRSGGSKSLEEIHGRLKDAIKEARQLLQSHYPDSSTIAISDCIFLIAPIRYVDAKSVLHSLLNAYQSTHIVVTSFLTNGFLLRGGVACGPGVFFDQSSGTLIGPPVLRAVAYEKLFCPPLVWLPQKELAVIDEDTVRAAFPNEPIVAETREGGLVATRIVIPSTYKELLLHLEKEYQHHVVNGDGKVAKAYRDARAILNHASVGNN